MCAGSYILIIHGKSQLTQTPAEGRNSGVNPGMALAASRSDDLSKTSGWMDEEYQTGAPGFVFIDELAFWLHVRERAELQRRPMLRMSLR